MLDGGCSEASKVCSHQRCPVQMVKTTRAPEPQPHHMLGQAGPDSRSAEEPSDKESTALPRSSRCPFPLIPADSLNPEVPCAWHKMSPWHTQKASWGRGAEAPTQLLNLAWPILPGRVFWVPTCWPYSSHWNTVGKMGPHSSVNSSIHLLLLALEPGLQVSLCIAEC